MNLFITANPAMAMAANTFAEHLAIQYQVPLQRRSLRTTAFHIGSLADSRQKALIAAVKAAAADLRLDTAVLPVDCNWARFALLASDMDSTLITIECIDEIADLVGKKNEVSAITEATMRGEIADFSESLKRRVALLKGTPETALEEVYTRRLRLTEGAEELLRSAHSHGLKTLLVSGGFTYFTERLKASLGLDRAHANVLGIEAGVLTGGIEGEVFGAEAKRNALLDYCKSLEVDVCRAIAIGDGANDLPMMRAAGLSVAFHGKPAVAAVADVAISFGGLDVLSEWL